MLTRRPMEACLLLCPLLLLGLALVQLDLVQTGQIGRSQVGGAALFGVVLLGLHLMLAGRARRSDQLLLPLASMLAALGMVTVTRLEPTLALRQGLWLAIGGLLLAVTMWLLPYVDWLKRYRYSAALLGIVLVLSTFALGVDPNGSG